MTFSSIKLGRAAQGLSQKGGVFQRPFEPVTVYSFVVTLFFVTFIKIIFKKISLARHLSRLELCGLQTVLQPQNFILSVDAVEFISLTLGYFSCKKVIARFLPKIL